MLEISNVTVHYGLQAALHDVSLKVSENEFVALLGSNGAGKTTLLNTISGMVRARSGTIAFDGKRIDSLPPYKIIAMGIAQVPEGRRILPHMTVEENLLLGAYAGDAWRQRRSSLERAYYLFPRLKERRNVVARALSGGEQQMLLIARGMMSLPRLLMVDEPSLGLAPIVLAEVYRVLERLREEKVTVLLSEQNARYALRTADRAYVLQDGRVALEGKGTDLLENDLVRKAYLGR